MKRLIFLFFLSITFCNQIFGQSELEIKTTGNYIYSWAIEYDKEVAKEKAKLGILDTIYISISNEKAVDKTDTIFIKVIDYFEKKVGLKWEVIAFADKEDVRIKLETRKKLKVIPVIIGEQTNNSVNDTYNNVIQDSSLIMNVDNTENDYSISETQTLETNNPVIDSLLTFTNSDLLLQQLNRYRSELLLNYGRESNFTDLSQCYIFVIDKYKQIVAVLDKGNDPRKNLLNNSLKEDYKIENDKNFFLYVILN